MPYAKSSRTPRTYRDPLPDYRLDPAALAPVLAALPPPWPGAPVAWRYARIRRVINEIAAFSPFNILDAMQAGRVVLVRHQAADLARRSLAHEVSSQLAARMRSMEARLLRHAWEMERSLRQRPPRAHPAGSPPASDAFDLAELDAIWCQDRTSHPAPANAAPAPSSTGRTGVLPFWGDQPGERR